MVNDLLEPVSIEGGRHCVCERERERESQVYLRSALVFVSCALFMMLKDTFAMPKSPSFTTRPNRGSAGWGARGGDARNTF